MPTSALQRYLSRPRRLQVVQETTHVYSCGFVGVSMVQRDTDGTMHVGLPRVALTSRMVRRQWEPIYSFEKKVGESFHVFCMTT
jgi:hypothetical protein